MEEWEGYQVHMKIYGLCLLTFSVSYFQSSEMKHFLLSAMQWITNVQLSPVPVSQMAGAGPLTCHVSRVICPHSGLPDRAEKHQVFIYKKGTLCSAHNTYNTISFCRPQFAPLSACPRSVHCVARCGVRRRRTCSPPWSRPWCCSSN